MAASIRAALRGDARISRPSPNLAEKLSAGDEQRRKEEAKRQEEQAELSYALNPQTLRKDLEALRREVKRLHKTIKEIQSCD